MLLGLDIGFGDVKAVGENDVKIKIPTAVAYAGEDALDLDKFSPSHREYVYSGRKYVIGEAAVSRAFSTRSFDFLKRYAPLLAYMAIEELPSSPTSMAIGLPLGYYTSGHEKDFASAMRKIVVDGRALEMDVEVYPQGLGAFFDYCLDENGDEREGTDISGLVINVGFNTVDVIAFENGSAIKADSGMIERAGISRPAQELARVLQAETTINLTEQEAKNALMKGRLSVYGYEKDLTENIRKVVEDYADWLMSVITSRWEDRVQRADRLILAGGGAYYLKTYIPAKYRRLLFVPEEPEFSNARGFFKAQKASAREKTAQ